MITLLRTSIATLIVTSLTGCFSSGIQQDDVAEAIGPGMSCKMTTASGSSRTVSLRAKSSSLSLTFLVDDTQVSASSLSKIKFPSSSFGSAVVRDGYLRADIPSMSMYNWTPPGYQEHVLSDFSYDGTTLRMTLTRIDSDGVEIPATYLCS